MASQIPLSSTTTGTWSGRRTFSFLLLLREPEELLALWLLLLQFPKLFGGSCEEPVVKLLVQPLISIPHAELTFSSSFPSHLHSQQNSPFSSFLLYFFSPSPSGFPPASPSHPPSTIMILRKPAFPSSLKILTVLSSLSAYAYAYTCVVGSFLNYFHFLYFPKAF